MSSVLVTGTNDLAERLAETLGADPAVERLIRVDTRKPALEDLVASSRADTVVHAAGEHGVLATLQLLAACQRSDTVRRLVIRSSTAVYGASPRDPAVFTEETPARSVPRSGPARDAVEIEGHVRAFGRRRPDITVTVLRFADVLGPTLDSSLARYLARPVVPVRLGFDPRLQFLHEDDAVHVLRLAAVADRPGVVNVAGDGVLLLSQALHRAGRLPLPTLGRGPGPLGYGRVVDTTRLREQFGYAPRFSTAETYAQFVASRDPVGSGHG